MKLKKIVGILAVTTVLAASLIGCSKNDKLELGQWDGHTFTNEWLDMKIEFPEDSHIASAEEIGAVIGAGEEFIVNSGNVNEAQVKFSKLTTAYDFMVILPDEASNVQLMYENVSITTLGKGITAEGYLDSVKSQLAEMSDFGYEFGEFETVQLGSKTFTKLPVTLLGGVMMQDYYCYSEGKYVASLLVTYLPDQQDQITEIVSGITTAK